MDPTSILMVGVFLGSILAAGRLARDMGRSQSRWAWAAALIGPLAIPMLLLVAATSTFKETINERRA